jgi:ssDNA-binding Zn-finger/Zn-ribbon topoisomerase 1
MNTREEAEKRYRQQHYLLKCPYCGHELVAAQSEFKKELFEPKETEEEVESFSIVDGKFVKNGKEKRKYMVSSDPEKDIYKGIKCCYCGHVWDELVNGMYEKRCNPDGRQTRVFELDEKETKAAKAFREKHNHNDELIKQGKLAFSTLGQQFTYTITPGGLGSCVTIKCDYCSEEEDITDIENW